MCGGVAIISLIAKPDRPAVRTDKTGQRHEERRLARTRWPKQRQEFARRNIQATHRRAL